MAEIVASFGVPHTPNFPELVRTKGPDCEVARLFAGVTENLEAVQPDILVVFDSDHLNTFFMNNLPTFSVGIADQVADAAQAVEDRERITINYAKSEGFTSEGLLNL